MRKRAFVILLPVAALMGFSLEVLKGNSGDAFRSTLGNMSTPWLVVALVAGFLGASALRGVLLGLSATMAALAGFYLGATVVFGDHLGAATGSFADEFVFIARANRVWFGLGLISGPVFGAIGGHLRKPIHVVWAAGLLLVLEPIAVLIAQGRSLPLIGGGWSADSLSAQLFEVVLGLAMLAAGLQLRTRNR